MEAREESTDDEAAAPPAISQPGFSGGLTGHESHSVKQRGAHGSKSLLWASGSRAERRPRNYASVSHFELDTALIANAAGQTWPANKEINRWA